jgi:hypothetical protein
MYVDELIRRNADPIFLLQNEMYEELYEWELETAVKGRGPLGLPFTRRMVTYF